MDYDPKEWYRAHNSKSFSVVNGKEAEFGVFVELCVASGKGLDSLDSLKNRAHEICEMATLSGYLTAR